MKEIVAKWRTHQELQPFTTLITLLKWKKSEAAYISAYCVGQGRGEKSDPSDLTGCQSSTRLAGGMFHLFRSARLDMERTQKWLRPTPFRRRHFLFAIPKYNTAPPGKPWPGGSRKICTRMPPERRALPWVTKNTNKCNYLQPQMCN